MNCLVDPLLHLATFRNFVPHKHDLFGIVGRALGQELEFLRRSILGGRFRFFR